MRRHILLARKTVRTAISLSVDIVSPPLRKRTSRPPCSRNCKAQQEYHDLGPTIHASRNKIVPLDELLGTIFPEVPLANKPNNEVNPDRGVNTDHKISHIPEDDR